MTIDAPLLVLLVIIALIWLSAIFSGSETGFYSLSRVKMRYRLSQGSLRARLVARMLDPIDITLITLLVANNICAQALSTISEHALAPVVGKAWAVPATICLLTPPVLVFAEYLPKHLFRLHADRWIYRLALITYALRTLLLPAVLLVRVITLVLRKLFGVSQQELWEPHTSRPNLRTFLGNQKSKHSLSPVQRELVERVLAMERITLTYHGVAKPLSTIASLDAGATVAGARNDLGPKYYQRYLVRSHQDGRPIGYVSAVDLVVADGARRISELTQELPAMSLDTPVHEALHTMHAAGADMALATDDADNPVSIVFRTDCLRLLTRLE